jgi:hypothetical protein
MTAMSDTRAIREKNPSSGKELFPVFAAKSDVMRCPLLLGLKLVDRRSQPKLYFF